MAIDLGMIIQIRLTETWGADHEIEARNRLCDALEAGLQQRDLGFFDGTDVGGGCTNLFIFEIPPVRWDEVLEFAISELTRRGFTKGVRIVRSVTDTAEDDDALPKHEVVWPEGAAQEWSIFYWIE